ncbi:Condensin complex subunit 2 [Trichinella pseudospiralis]|uniref:Condensin complex subunit 2 n=1 Tax=Trichinella pseudospiralis TaxID=6337 RepID=A0A0V1JD92_TRIPS|nr:Condensin complex subunit 2 [Trichinella pseudospiralis]KRZ46302.1 Condensin complex subunit 2 [Trichinella pseudospiralis]
MVESCKDRFNPTTKIASGIVEQTKLPPGNVCSPLASRNLLLFDKFLRHYYNNFLRNFMRMSAKQTKMLGKMNSSLIDLEQQDDFAQIKDFLSSESFSQGTESKSENKENKNAHSLSTPRVFGKQEVVTIYHQCCQLSAHNKITIKNAFSLQLLDVLKEVASDQADNLDFAGAGKALEAGSKIYGCRVDNVHQQTHQLFNKTNREHLVENTESNELSPVVTKAKKRKSRVNVIETNLKNITLTFPHIEAVSFPRLNLAGEYFDQGVISTAFSQICDTMDDYNGKCLYDIPLEKPELPEKPIPYVAFPDKEIIGCSVIFPSFEKVTDDVPRSSEKVLELLGHEPDDNDITVVNAAMQFTQQLENLTDLHQDVMNMTNDFINEDEDCETTSNLFSEPLHLDNLAAMVSMKELKYSYFDPERLPHEFRKAPIVSGPKKPQQRGAKKRKVEEMELDFDTILDYDEVVNDGCKRIEMSEQTLHNLVCNRVVCMDDFNFIPELFMRIWSTGALIKSNLTSDCQKAKMLNTMEEEFNSLKNVGYSDDDEDFAENNMECEISAQGTQATVQAEGNAQSSDTCELSLLAEWKNAFMPLVACSSSNRKIDVQHIKAISMQTLENSIAENSECKFSEIVSNLRKQGKSPNEEFSVAASFVCLLHLANENNLQLTTSQESDIIVKKN